MVGSGSSLSFSNGASLIVNGTFSAVGAPTDRISFTSSSVSWGGIVFNSGSSGSLQYCDISNASTGIRINGTAAPTVRYCNLSNISTTGIYLDCANVQLKIDNNAISSNSCGVYSYYSNSTLEQNTIFGAWEGVWSYGSYDRMSNNSITTWEYGVFSDYYSQTSLLGRLEGYAGYNRILYAGSVALLANFGSEIRAGQYSWNPGLNSFYDGGIDPKAVAGDNSSIIAQYNWWDSDQSSYGNVDNSNPLDYDPNAGMRAGGNPVANSLSSQLVPGDSAKSPTLLDAELLAAHLAMDQGKYNQAITEFFDKYKKENNLQRKKYALARLADCYGLANRTDFIDFLNGQIRPSLIKSDELFVESLELEGNSLIRGGQYDKAVSLEERIKSGYSDKPENYKHALFNLANLYSGHLGEFGKAAENVGLLKSQYPNDILTRRAQSTASAVIAPSKANLILEVSKKEAPKDYALQENYPNPFNPSTVIPFSIPIGGHVTLVIYNSLGQRVASLVDAEVEVGYHEVKFDASRLASGVYFYRLQAGNFVQTKKLLLLR